jgi:hypothetical protein
MIYNLFIFNEAQATCISISKKNYGIKIADFFFCEVFTLSVINVQKIIMGCNYFSDLGAISMPDTISARFCVEYMVKYLCKVNFVGIEIKLRNNLSFLFKYKLTRIIFFKILYKKNREWRWKILQGGVSEPQK